MKNTLYHIFILLFATLFLISCEQETFNVTLGKEKEVTLTLRLSSDDLKSRAEAGDDTYNENVITKVDLYLYSTGGAGQALYKVPTKTFSNTTTEAQLTTTLSNDLVDDLFDANGKCHAYALVNYPGTAPDANTDASIIVNLKKMDITATFNNKTGIQTSFVMDGESNSIEYDASSLTVEGEVKVNRAASKIALFVTGVDKTVTDDAGNVWEPDYTAMDISFHNGVNKAKVDVGYDNNRPNNPNTTGNYFATSGARDITAELDNTKTTDAIFALNTSHVPFYSYSSDWGRDTNPDTEPTITLMVPWRKVRNHGEETDIPKEERKWQTCYYQIPVNVKSIDGSLADCMERNMYYKISFHVGILGDFNPATPTIITASYYTVDWKTQNVDVDIKNYKYLVVDKNDVTVYNENEVRIGYASSDAIKAEITYIRRPDYSDEKVDTTRFHGTLASTSGLSTVPQGTNSLLRQCAVTIENNEIVLKHDIVNQSANSGTNYDYVPYYIWIKVTMTVTVNGENKTFTEWIRYEQYPEIYIKAYPNSDTNASNTNESYRGYVYVYNNNKVADGWNDVVRISSGGNHNPNMYVITVSALDDGSNFILGDPRNTTSISGSTANWNIYNYDDNNERLQYYYETKTDASAELIIAPRFRMASSHGKCNGDMSYFNARRRCAAYQEDGYPAGRWRVPTTAEFKYIAKLSGEGKIPHLYSDGKLYWTSTEYCTYSTSGTIAESNSTSGEAFVRCVYDEWYWGDAQIANKTTFTWGDAPRN